MEFDAFHLPPAGPDDAVAEPRPEPLLQRDDVLVRALSHSPADLDATCRRLLAARPALRAMPSSRVVAAVDGAAARLMEAPLRQQVEAGLVAATGYSPAMAAEVLERMARDWTAPALNGLLEAELGGVSAVDGFVQRAPGLRSRLEAPALGFHVFAGNVPGVSVTSLIRSLLVRTAVLGKVAAGEPVLAPVFARLLAEANAEVGACVAVTWWAGGDEALEAAVLRHAGIVVHYGGADALRSLRRRAPADTPFIDHGPRISFALVRGSAGGPGGDPVEIARAVAMFDQQGCVSPQMLYVLGSPADARALAEAVAGRLGDIAHELPRGRIDAGEAAAIRELRSSAEFRAIAGADVEVWAGEGLAWTVIFDADPTFSGSCLNRTLVVKCLPDLDLLDEVVRPLRRYLQSVGIAGFDDAEAVARRLGAMGVSRVCPIAQLPWPPPAWHHDGRGPLLELGRWVDLEE